MQLPVFLIFVFVSYKSVLSQDISYMFWKNDSVLEWSDFREIESKSAGKFHIECGIEFYLEDRTDSTVWHVNSYFDPNLSWASTDSRNRISLSVAKCYFEITEIWARKLRKSFIELDSRGASDLQYYFKFKKINRQLDKEIRKFSSEVDGGENTDNYVLWRERIMQELKELSGYTATTGKSWDLHAHHFGSKLFWLFE